MARSETDNASAITAAIVKIASRCNLNCKYCYLYNHEDASFRQQPKFMSLQTFQAGMERLREYCEARGQSGVAVALHGGEPTLIGSPTLRRMCAIARDTLGKRLHRLAMQTNATLLDDDILSVVEEFDVALGISLDGDQGVHDSQRLHRNGRGSYQATAAGIARLRARGLRPRVLCVVQPGQDGAEIYYHFREIGVDSIDFLLPDVSHDTRAAWYGHCGAHPVAAYLIPAFDAWLREDDPDVHVGLFHDLVKAVLGGQTASDAFGNPLMSYLILESNGDIEALDALKVCGEGMTATGLNVHRNALADIEHSDSLLKKAMFDGFKLSAVCEACAERDVCGGGYLPHRFSKASGFDNPSVWCDDILRLLAHVRARVEQFA